MDKVLITGGTGLVGKHLSEKLKEKDYSVVLLSRKKNVETEISTYSWDLDKEEIQTGALESVDYIIHLAGANIGEKRWTAKRKKQIIDSRIKSSGLIYDKIKHKEIKPKAFISASAIGYYGAITAEKVFYETDLPASDFLGETCRLWEQSADKFKNSDTRVVKIRTGVVLAEQGGALSKMIVPVKLGFGSAIGSGKQYMPWIHIDDLCNIYIKAIEDIQMSGAYNAVAPQHTTNVEFTRALASILKKPFWFPAIPAFMLKMIFGEMAEMLLRGSRVSSEKIIKAGYKFKFANLQAALTDLLL